MKSRLSIVAVVTFAMTCGLALHGYAGEKGAGPLRLLTTNIKTHDAITTLPKCHRRVAAFSPTKVTCPRTSCALEVLVTSELSDVSPGADSVRFYAILNGSFSGVLPTSNFGALSTAKAGLIEAATASYMIPRVDYGVSTLEVQFCVADTSGDGTAHAFMGDRTLVVRTYLP